MPVPEVHVPGEGILGHSAALRAVLAQVDRIASTDATVLILGESGTGKELVARAIHRQSLRAHHALVKVNCSAVPRELFESEFFGHVRGSFTGAHTDRAGRFQLAHKGTLFLDEIGDLPLELQPKLLRVLQEGQFERVGDSTTSHVEVRVVAATHRDLGALVAKGKFREDLLYRLHVLPIDLPPLRARKDDIPELAAHFVARAARRFGVPEPALTVDVCAQLVQHDWPGNVRELDNFLQRAVILSCGASTLQLPPLADGRRTSPAAPTTLVDVVREHILAVLCDTGGVIGGPAGAAARLGLKRTTLQAMMRRVGISRLDIAMARDRLAAAFASPMSMRCDPPRRARSADAGHHSAG
jgi:transcriptional regulator with GAF, ATPase, and Fis domain